MRCMRFRVGIAIAGLATAVAGVSPLAAQESFTLGEAVREALANHPSTAVALEGVAGADAEIRQARASGLPTLSLQGEVVRYELPMVVAPLHTFDPARAPEFDETLIRSRAILSWLLFDGHATRASIEGSRAARDGLVAQRDDTSAKLIERTTKTYLETAVARQVLEASEERIIAVAAEQDRVERHLAEGRAAEVERLRAAAGLREAEADEASARSVLRVREGTLARLTGRDPSEIRVLRLEVPAPPEEASLRADSEANLPPAVVAAQNRVRAAEAAFEAARGARLPRVEAVAGLSQFGGAGSSTTAEWDAGIRVSWPIFTGGARSGAEEGAQAELRQAREGLRETELQLDDAVERADAGLDEAFARREALKAATEALEEVTRIEALALDAGTGVQRDFLEAHASLLEARAGLAEAHAAILISHVSLARATGQLDVAWLAENMEGVR